MVPTGPHSSLLKPAVSTGQHLFLSKTIVPTEPHSFHPAVCLCHFQLLVIKAHPKYSHKSEHSKRDKKNHSAKSFENQQNGFHVLNVCHQPQTVLEVYLSAVSTSGLNRSRVQGLLLWLAPCPLVPRLFLLCVVCPPYTPVKVNVKGRCFLLSKLSQ